MRKKLFYLRRNKIMVTGIEKFTQKDGLEVLKVWLSPTKEFPNGSFFYCEARDYDLVVSHPNWSISDPKQPYVLAGASIASASSYYRFHVEVARKYCSELPEAIDHYNGVEFDCVNRPNLFSVSTEQNGRNRRSKGYVISASGSFRALLILGREMLEPYSTVRNEVQVLILRNQLEQTYFSDYNYNFLADRRTSLDLLLQEREGILSHDDAVYLYLKKYSANPWFYFRYDLAEAYDYYGLEKPEEGKDYWIAKDGFMINRDGMHLLPEKWLSKKA